MNQFIKHKFIVLCSNIILLLPLSNALHFVLIDHELSIFSIKKNKITHQCDDYILYQVYTENDFNLEINPPVWINFIQIIDVFYQINSFSTFFININNRGPPEYLKTINYLNQHY